MQKSRKFHFLAFGAGADYPGAARRLAGQAKSTGLFTSVSWVTGDDIFSRWPEFRIHRPFIESNPRGWGYWIWKPFLIRNHLDKLNDGEALVYFDAGCEILPQNSKKLSRHLDYLNDHDQMIWSYAEYPIFNLVFWTKQNLLDRAMREFALTDLVRSPKVWAGIVGFVKTERNLSLTDDWVRLAAAENYTLLDDTPTSAPQIYPFFGHRHDQSILSLLVAAYDMKSCGSAFDFCYGEPHIRQWPILLDKPFLAMRNYNQKSQIEPFLKSFQFTLKRYLQKISARVPSSKQNPIMGWSQEHAEFLTIEHRDILVELGLL